MLKFCGLQRHICRNWLPIYVQSLVDWFVSKSLLFKCTNTKFCRNFLLWWDSILTSYCFLLLELFGTWLCLRVIHQVVHVLHDSTLPVEYGALCLQAFVCHLIIWPREFDAAIILQTWCLYEFAGYACGCSLVSSCDKSIITMIVIGLSTNQR